VNSSLLRWLLDIDAIPADAGTLNLVWERPLSAWLWALIIALAIAFAVWSYWRLQGRRLARYALAGVRAAALLLVMVVISGPMLELPREVIKPDWVLMLVDRSESMTIEDAPTGDAGDDTRSSRRSREQQLQQVLRDNGAVWSALEDNRRVVWLGFHTGAFSLAEAEPSQREDQTAPAPDAGADPATAEAMLPVELTEPTGSRTRLGRAIEQALQRAAARPISGVVVFSDGRTDDPPDRSVLRRLQADQIRVFSVPLGSDRPLGDLAVRRVEAPTRAFTRDKVPVVVEVDRLGAAGQQIGATVRLIDNITGDELDAADLKPGEGAEQVTLTATPNLTGEATWRVVVDTDEPDLIPENNMRSFAIELIDRPLNVLFADGYPRWEYRYLKNLMVREKSIESSVMLISADRDFAQEGNMPITRLPRSPEEFADYDVLVIGDVPGSFYSPDQLEMMRNHVAERGAGLLWIGGPRYTPSSYTGTPLADLLPIRGSLKLEAIGERVNMQPTELAERLGVLQLAAASGVGWPQELRDPSYNWSQLSYAQRIEPGRLKPTAVPLAETTTEFNGSPLPLVVHMRYGAGQIIYVATDEIWRWRYGRGEDLTEQFWVQIIRMLGRETLAGASQRVALSVAPRRAEAGQPVRIEVRLLDEQLIDAGRTAMNAVIETLDGETVAEVQLSAVEQAEDHFATTYLLDRPGDYRVRIPMVAGTSIAAEAPLEVFAPEDELRRPETDHDLLAELSTATNGRFMETADLQDLPELLPNRSVRTLNPLTERIWDTPLVFIVAVLLLAMEWIGRKIVRLI